MLRLDVNLGNKIHNNLTRLVKTVFSMLNECYFFLTFPLNYFYRRESFII